MPRPPRLFVVGMPSHIVQRGHNRQVIFLEDEHYQAYLDDLSEQKAQRAVRVFAYCLMSNHVHLILQPDDSPDSISGLMRVLAGRHTRRINKREQRTGTLWEGRFKASLIDTDRYMAVCGCYVDLNPVRAGIVARPELYRWSSYRFRAGLESAVWLDQDPAWLARGSDRQDRALRYREFVALGLSESDLTRIRDSVQRNQLTGSETFPERILAKTGQAIPSRGPGRPAKGK